MLKTQKLNSLIHLLFERIVDFLNMGQTWLGVFKFNLNRKTSGILKRLFNFFALENREKWYQNFGDRLFGGGPEI